MAQRNRNARTYNASHPLIGKYVLGRGNGTIVAILSEDMILVETPETDAGPTFQWIQLLRPDFREHDEPEPIFFTTKNEADEFMQDPDSDRKITRLEIVRPEGNA